MLNILYIILLPIVAIILFPMILIAFLLVPKFTAGFWEKIGFYNCYNIDNSKKSILIHAVSVGEVNAIERFLKRLKNDFGNQYNIILSTVTKTGNEVANKKLTNYTDKIVYFPFDFFFSVISFLSRYKFEKIIIAETEIWPCFIYFANLKHIQTYIINARISDNSFKGYKKIKFFIKPILNKYSKILTQSQEDRQKLIDLGANPLNTINMGNLKFDIEANLDQSLQTLKEELKLESKLFIAASTHSGEDEIILSVYKKLKQNIGNLKLIIAPRHPQRYLQVENLLKSSEFYYSKRSINGTFLQNDILLLDTIGELSKIYSICDIAFIGGSFSNTGGHNPLEATIFQKPTITGPSIFNFKDIYKILLHNKASFIAQNDTDLFNISKNLLINNESYLQAQKNSLKVFSDNQGAINFAISEIFLNQKG